MGLFTTMKKIYQQPSITVVSVAENLPFAASITIINKPQNEIQGDVKADWSDIWDDPSEDFENDDF